MRHKLNIKPGRLIVFGLLLLAFVLIAESDVLAQNSLGLGRSEPAIKPEGPFATILFWIQQQQKGFYRSLTAALKSIRSGNGGTWLLVTLSFSYGILHAAGPGHGKAVISSYMLANEVQLRRGVFLSFLSSALQASVAIIAIGLLIFVLTGLGIRQSGFTRWLEIISYGGVTLLGLWLIWKKLFGGRSKSVHSHGHHGHGHTHDHSHDHSDGGEVCSECGHSHAPDPEMLEGQFGLREALAAIFAVGLRPCTGALIVLTFAFLNGLYWAGILSAFAMAIGTAITVSGFATLAVGGKNLALKMSGQTRASANVLWWIEFAGALFILLLGVTLLSASLY